MDYNGLWYLLLVAHLRTKDSVGIKHEDDSQLSVNVTSANSTSWVIYDVFSYQSQVVIDAETGKYNSSVKETSTNRNAEMTSKTDDAITPTSEALFFNQTMTTEANGIAGDVDVDFDDDAADYDDYLDEEGDDQQLPTEQRLMNMLMRNYERAVRPVNNASERVLVRMGLTLTQIFNMDEKNQVLVTNVWLDQEWDDMFLTWNPDDYGGLRVLRLPCYKIWLPDIVLYNNAAEYTNSLMPANAMITYQGEVFWPIPTKLQSTCKVDITYFPFDEQFCRLKFGSWTYDGFQVDMTNRTTEVDLSNYVENGEWELLEIKIQRNVVYYPCCKEPFPDVTFTIHIRRRIIYYIYNIIFPCVMMSMLTLLVFCLPPESGEKVTMGITVLLAFSVFLLRMGEDLPETSEFIPLLSIYLTIVMAMTSVSVILTVFVLNLHYKSPNQRPVPIWLRRLFIRREKVQRGLTFNKDDVDEYYADAESHYAKNVSLRLTIENLAQELKEELDNNTGSRTLAESSQTDADWIPNDRQQGGAEPTEMLRPGSRLFVGNANNVGISTPNLRTSEQILQALKTVIRRYERDDTQEFIVYEWRLVAVAVDRVLFWIFLIGTLASTVLVLIVSPLTKWF